MGDREREVGGGSMGVAKGLKRGGGNKFKFYWSINSVKFRSMLNDLAACPRHNPIRSYAYQQIISYSKIRMINEKLIWKSERLKKKGKKSIR